VSYPDRIEVERQGVVITMSQAVAIDRLCGGVHGQSPPFDYEISPTADAAEGIWVNIGKRHYLIGRAGAIAFSTIGERQNYE
jgi:hypothetical protein